MKFIKDLSPGETFTIDNHSTIYVCEAVRTGKPKSTVSYRIAGNPTGPVFEFTRVNLSTVKIVEVVA